MLTAASPVAPLGSHELLMFLLQVGLLLGAAVLLGRLALRLGMPSVVGELCAGVVLGPSLLVPLAPGFAEWLLPQGPGAMHLLDAVGQIGVLLLVGITGMNVDLGLVRRKGRAAVLVSVGGLVVPFAGGVAVAAAVPAALLVEGTDRTVFALFAGVALCVSALPVIAKTLLDMGLLHRDIGQLTIGASVLDDIAGWLLLSVVSAMATTGVQGAAMVWTVLSLLAFVLCAWFAGQTARRPPAAVVDAERRRLGARAVHRADRAGRRRQPRHPHGGRHRRLPRRPGDQLLREMPREKLAPLRTVAVAVLAPLFFATAGLRIDLTALARLEVLGTALLVLFVAVVSKYAGAYAGARAGRLGHWEGLALGAGMNARGVIEVIIAMVGLRLGILTTGMYTIIVLVAIVTSVMAPPLLRLAVRRMPVTVEERAREQLMNGAAGAGPKAHTPAAGSNS
ncbi:cation:proton antiporter [Streptomyces albus]|nr:cation:proton antiporter [Streptomyces albus]